MDPPRARDAYSSTEILHLTGSGERGDQPEDGRDGRSAGGSTRTPATRAELRLRAELPAEPTRGRRDVDPIPSERVLAAPAAGDVQHLDAADPRRERRIDEQ